MESPISASLGAMGPLLRKLDMLLLGPSEGLLQLHKGAKRWTHLLKDDLEEITSYLQDLSEVEDPPLTAKCWMKEVRELSYDIENYIDSFVLPGHVANIKTRSGRRRRCCCRCRRIRVRHIKVTRLLETNKKLNRRKRVAARISDFRIDAREALERHKRYELHCCASIRRGLLPAAGRLPTTCEEGAGIIIDDRMRKFMDSMADDRDPQLKVVSVVGSEGIGKTTLVKVLYHKLKGQFDCRAFIRLTRKPDIKTVLRDILTQVQQQPHNHCEDSDLLGKIREHLQYKRYLIVIDDLWSASIWDVISYAFPGGKMCSRIITSTQIEDVALACCYYHSEYVFKMRPLDEDLSRELFFNSLFRPENDFPQRLKDVLNKIVKICSGLPLATTIIARLLATHPVILMEQWTYIYDSLSSKLRTSSSASEGMKLVVNFSYNNLTCHLKTCLLYLSMYPEGCTVCKDDLVKQWVSEGFIDGSEGREVETAESYFHELIGRRFLQPERIKYTGEVASCSVHEVVRDLIAQKSSEENFVVVLDRHRRNVSHSENVHRLSLHFPYTKYAMTNIRSSQIRSLTCFGLSKCMPSIKEFKLLRVLNLNLSGHDDNDDGIIDLTGISDLLRLRYLKVASDVCVELPKHMGRLRYLETLDISKKVTDVASDIIDLPRLLHLHLPLETNLMYCLDMTGPAASVWSLGKLSNLRYLYLTYSIPVPDHLQRNMEALGSLFRGHGSLKTLAFILSSVHKNAVAHSPSEATITWDWDDFTPPFLERFEWLLHSCSFSRVPKWIGELGNLCILKISVKELMRDGVNILGELPALTTLSLYVKIAPVKRIIFDKAGFSVLKYFKFMCSTVPWLKFEAEAMPNLQKLKLGFSAHRVGQQSTIPISIEHLPSLKEISAKVGDASSDAESALMAAVSNHPRNPRIRMQLVDWNSYGHGVWYTVSKQENPLTLEEDNIPDPEEGLDDHFFPQYKDSRDDQNKEAYVSLAAAANKTRKGSAAARHDGHDDAKKRRKENSTENLENLDTSTSLSVIEGSVQNNWDNWDFENFTASSSYASTATYASPPPNITNKDGSSGQEKNHATSQIPALASEYLAPYSQLELNQSIASGAHQYPDRYYAGMVTTCGSQAVTSSVPKFNDFSMPFPPKVLRPSGEESKASLITPSPTSEKDSLKHHQKIKKSSTGKRVVIKMSLQRDKDWPKIINITASKEGVSSVLREGDNLVVCGTCDPVDLLSSLRKHNLGDVQLVSADPANSNKETVQIVIKMGLQTDKAWSKITEIAAMTHGVSSFSRDGDNLVVCGTCDPVGLLSSLRKHNLGDVQLVSVGLPTQISSPVKEHLFEKTLTPSDVGKLNRLVIPKQYAERYFPLSGDSGEKGLILSCEDEAGKPWRFRCSYWRSSQSYVLTKDWSRYVKEKQLGAGDMVHFERMRGFGLGDRLFISYRHCGVSATAAAAPPPPAVRVVAPAQSTGGEQQPWSPMCYSTSGSYPTSPANSHAYRHSVDHDHSNMQHAGESQSDRDNRSRRRSGASAPSSQRLRLFGVNLDCGPGPELEPETPTAMYGYMHQSPYTSNNWGRRFKTMLGESKQPK